MSGIKDQQNMDDLRKRLYDRGSTSIQNKRHQLTQIQTDVSRGWAGVKPLESSMPILNKIKEELPEEPELVPEENIVDIAPKKTNRSYRKIIILGSIAIFALVATVSSIFLFFGANQISAKNISITATAPFAIAAGEKLSMQIGISNQNSVEIESATLIVNYPPGTKTADTEARDLYEERIPINVMAPGEAINVPLNIILFGEENEEKEIKATIEYRVVGSNGTFFKDAEPIKIKINSSPLVLRVDSIEKISSGQEMEIKITLQSNASVVQRDILISASYPNTFSFVKSDPEPSYGQNEWIISEIKPETSKVITLKGKVSGVANELSEIQFTVGTPRSDNQYLMGSVMAKAKTSYTLERPFIDVEVAINQDSDGSAVIEADSDAKVVVKVVNTLQETIYDMKVAVTPNGNLIRDDQLILPTGFYESGTKTITWEVSGMSSLAEVLPGETRTFEFSVKADPKQTTGSFDVSTDVFARRVGESAVEEVIVGTAVAEAKYSSKLNLASQIGYGDGPFQDTGAVPPIAGKVTTYTLTFEAKAGVNDVTNVVLTTSLPQYVSWLATYEGEGEVDYNPVAKQMLWKIGSLNANSSKQLQVQVSLLPSVTQVGRTPVMVGSQELSATDRFTGVNLRTQYPALNNILSEEAGFEKGNGVIQSSTTSD